jgi:hypothetical protein
MIKTWLKHQIYEYCIDIIYQQIFNNFVLPKYKSFIFRKWEFTCSEHLIIEEAIQRESLVDKLKDCEKKIILGIQQEIDNDILKELIKKPFFT